MHSWHYYIGMTRTGIYGLHYPQTLLLNPKPENND